MRSPSPTSETNNPQKGIDALYAWREKNINLLAKTISITAVIAYIANWIFNYKILNVSTHVGYTIILGIVLFATYYPRLSTVARAAILTTMILAAGIQSAIDFSTAGDARTWFLLAIFLATIFIGRKAGILFSIAFLLIWVVMAYLFSIQIISTPSFSPVAKSLWVGTAISTLIFAVIITLAISNLLSNLNKTIEENLSLVKTSEKQNIALKEQHDLLEKRTKTLEATATISQELAILTDYDKIIDRIPMLLNNTLMLNASFVFLFNEEKTLYQASRQIKATQAKNTRVPLSSEEKDLVNRSVADKHAYSTIISTAQKETQALLAIPLLGRESMLGALLLQSNDTEAFGAESISILQMLVNHIAILLENANLLVQKESALEAERRAYGKIVQDDWQKFIARQEFGSYRRDEKGLRNVQTEAYSPKETEAETMAVPIRIRGKTIGHIDAQKPKNRVWTAAEKELLSVLSSRLETAIDGARLYQEAQERAEREEIIARTSSRVRERLSVEKVLETAVQELRKSLNIDKSEIWLHADYMLEEDSND